MTYRETMTTANPTLTLRQEPPRYGACACCGGRTTSLVGFVFRDGAPYAVYYAAFAENHSEGGVQALVSLGDWSAAGSPERRTAFVLRIAASPAGYRVEPLDAESSPWRDATLVGRLLRRDEAMVDPLLREALQVADELVAQAPEIGAFLGPNARNPAAAVPEA